MSVDPSVLGVLPVPQTVEEAIALLERVADERSEYRHDDRTDDRDLLLSIEMFRVAAEVLRTGDVRGWTPSWKWHLYASDNPRCAMAKAEITVHVADLPEVKRYVSELEDAVTKLRDALLAVTRVPWDGPGAAAWWDMKSALLRSTVCVPQASYSGEQGGQS